MFLRFTLWFKELLFSSLYWVLHSFVHMEISNSFHVWTDWPTDRQTNLSLEAPKPEFKNIWNLSLTFIFNPKIFFPSVLADEYLWDIIGTWKGVNVCCHYHWQHNYLHLVIPDILITMMKMSTKLLRHKVIE